MKRSFLFNILWMIFLCITLFASCENFLKAKETQQQIEASIAYANADSYKIIFKSEKNSGIITKPAGGEISAKVTDTFDIAFNPESDHEFIRWEIFDASTNNIIQNNDYLKIEDLKTAETTCSFLKAPDKTGLKLGVRAIVAERPQIIRRRPADTPGGVLQNSAIEITFDHDMNESSIYYSTQEKSELMEELNLAETDFLKDGTKLYGYTKDNHKYYKNITITNNKNNSNLLSYFDKPFFADSRTLIIRPLNPPPNPETDILCSFNKDFSFLYEDGTSICMRETEKFIYSTNVYKSKRPRIQFEWFASPTEDFHFWTSSLEDIVLNEDGVSLSTSFSDEIDSIYHYQDSQTIRLGIILIADDLSGSCLKKEFSLQWYKVTRDSQNHTIHTEEETLSLIPFESFSEDYSYASCGYGEAQDAFQYPDPGYRCYYYNISRSSDFLSTKGMYCFNPQVQNNQSPEPIEGYYYYVYLESDYSPE